MKPKYKIRQATAKDIFQIRKIIRESVADDKKLIHPSSVTNSFMEDFVDKIIKKGNMLVVENEREEMELIGEIHMYNNHGSIKELAFISRKVFDASIRETELVNWLFGEIKTKHQDVFRVELAAPVCHSEAIDYYLQMGLRVEGQYNGRLNKKPAATTMVVPLSWINASYN